MPIVASKDFKPSDPFGLYRSRTNPLAAAPVPAAASDVPEDPEAARLRNEIAVGEQQNQRTQTAWQQLEAQEPGRYQVIDEAGLETWQADWQDRQPGWLEDTARVMGGSMAKGAGAVVGGLGNAINSLTNATTTPIINQMFGTEFGQVNPLDAPAEWLTTLGEKTQEGVSYATRQAIADSTPGGDLLDPGSWTLGKNPSAVGYAALALDVFGQMTPVIAASIAMGPMAGAAVGGLQGGGAAAQQAEALIDQMAAEPGVLERESAFYREMLAAGKTHEEALAATKAAAAQAAFALTAPISALGGFATGRIIDPATAVLAGRNIIARIAGRAGLSAAEEGAQEAAETAATRAGTNVGADTELALTEGTFADFMLGALGGGLPGAVAGALSPRTVTSEAPAEGSQAAPQQPQPDVRTGPVDPATEKVINVDLQPSQAPKGPLAGALEHGLSQAPHPQAGATFIVNDPPLPGFGAGPEHGMTVTLAPNQAGIDPNMRRVLLPDGSERVMGVRLLEAVDGSVPAPDPQATSTAITVSNVHEGLPTAGQRVIVELPDSEPFTAKIEQFVTAEGTAEALVVTDDGEVLQVPTEFLKTQRLSDQFLGGLNRTDNPPVERDDPAPETPTSRRVGNATLDFPSETLARLYDLGAERRLTKTLNRASSLDMRELFPDEVQRLADELGVLPERVNAIADDYRYRAERAARGNESGLVQKMHGLGTERLATMQSERRRAEGQSDPAAAASADPDALWWNGLPLGARKALLTAAGVKRSEKTAWEKFSRSIKGKLAPLRVEQEGLRTARERSRALDAAAEEAATSPANDLPVFGKELSTEDEVRSAARAAADESNYPDVADEMAEKAVERWKLDRAANEAATSPANDLPEPTEAQKRAGNYKSGHFRLAGLDLTIENPAGSERKGTDSNGKAWSVAMKSHYGYIKGTRGRDKDHIDVFVKPGTDELTDDSPVFVVDQRNPGNGHFDEHKVMMGFSSEEEARAGYLENYTKGWKGLGAITQTTLAEFKRWLADGNTTEEYAKYAKAAELKPLTREEEADIYRRAQVEADGYAYPDAAEAFAEQAVEAARQERFRAIDDAAEKARDRSADEAAKSATGSRRAKAIADKYLPARSDETVMEVRPPKAEASSSTADQFSKNKLFTADKVEAARARLRSKLGQLNSGIDPEVLVDGMTIAGAYIEAGVRDFADYASRMTDDFGDRIKPYLLSFWEAARHYPGLDTEGMTSAEDSARLHRDIVDPAPAEPDADQGEARPAEPDTLSAPAGDDIVAAEAAQQQPGAPRRDARRDGEPRELDRDDPAALEGAPADAVRGAEEGRDAGSGTQGSGRTDISRDRPARAVGDSAGRGVADGARAIPAATGGDGGRRAVVADADGDAGAQPRREGAGRSDIRDPGPAARLTTPATPAQQRAIDYVISETDRLGEGGQKTKFRNNVAAIELLRALTADRRAATRDEQAVLAKWVGWGGLRPAFPREDGSVAKGWEAEAAQLKALLSDDEYRAAESSTRNAHYTSPEIVQAIWSIVERLGFKGGQVLEPSVGAGNFLGLMPGGLREGSRITGVELDAITGGIAQQLYPSANIQAPVGFQELRVPDGYFDLAVGNPPFGSERVYDKERRVLNRFSIHNFFFAKSVDALRPGGVLAMVITNRFLDGSNAGARAYIADRTDLIGAIRLPNDAFLKNAGTEVTTDIIVLRKRREGEPKGDSSWQYVDQHTDAEGRKVPLNRYFKRNPDMMLGDFGGHGSMYGPDEPALVARQGQDTPALLAAAIEALPRDIMELPGAEVVTETVTPARSASDALVGSVFLDDGKVMQRLPDVLGEVRARAVDFPNEKAGERVAGMIRVRDAFARLRRAQISEESADAQLANLRERLNKVYDAFVKTNGPINLDANKRLMRDDPSWPQLAALEEKFDKGLSTTLAKRTGEQPRSPSAQKAAIFSRRTQSPYRRPSEASTAKDALAASLSELGRIDLGFMSDIYGKSPEVIVQELGPLVFRTPAGAYETADAYLSGNVKAKLAEVERAVTDDPEMRRNVAALRDVQPADIEAVDIDVKAGAPWVPSEDVAVFVDLVTGARGGKAVYSRSNARWIVDARRPSDAAEAQWATDRVSVSQVIDAALNGATITVRDRVDDKTTVVNQAATDAANDKVERVKSEWKRWIWEDDGRRERLVRLYNDTFNTDVIRAFDGSHLALPGKVSDDIIRLRPHQKNFVWRTLQNSTALADHTVGAGKTFSAIAAVMELRRTGLANKPMLVVPNHLVGQWAADFIKLYPGAKVLAATKADFEKDNRKKLFARITTGDWDAVIVAHSSFGRIGVSAAFEERFIREQIQDLEDSIKELRAQTGEKSRNVAQLTKWRDTMAAKLQRLLDAGAKDDGLTFDELGVDAVFVDELHEFKNLGFATSMQRVAGLGNTQGSQKAADLYMKSRSVLERGGRFYGLTGTPLSNTMAEMFTLQRYLDQKALNDLGLAHFDAWARVFGEVVTDWELSPSGQYKLNSRFAKFVNMPELMQRYLSFADVITNDDIRTQLAAIGQTLPLPKVKGGKPTNIVVARSTDQAAYIGEGKAGPNGELTFEQGTLVWRAENLPKKAEKGADNMLKVMSDARKAALDMRLIDPSYADVPGSKVHTAADRIRRIYDTWNGERGTQLVFIDLSTPKKAKAAEANRIRDLIARAEAGDDAAQQALDAMSPDEFMALDGEFSVYDDLRDKLVARGIPANEVVFIHDANTEAQKEELFGKVRSGRVRVLLGSTAKMGAGTNVQNRLVALHHLDAPWRPSDLEQRDGRGIRQGNELYAADPDGFEIEILRYATKNTLDARQWQTIEGKARFIDQMRKGNLKTREIEDIAGEAANAAEMKAAASGNPLILEEMDLRQRLRRLDGARSEHEREQHRIRHRIRKLTDEQAFIERSMEDARADAEKARAFEAGEFTATIANETLGKPKDMGAAIVARGRRMLEDGTETVELGQIGDFALSIDHLHTDEFVVGIEGARRHDVSIHGIQETDPAGLGRRILNTLRSVAGEPQRLATRRDEISEQIPALEKQLRPWADQEQFETLTARHREVLAALQPRRPSSQAGDPAESQPATADAAQEPPRRESRSVSRAVSDGGPAAIERLRAELAAAALGDAIRRLEDTGRLRITTAAEADAGEATQAWTDPDGSITLIADNIDSGEAVAVLLHEAFHSGARPLLGDRNWGQLMRRLAGLYRQFEASNGKARQFFDAARARVRTAEGVGGRLPEGLAVEEFGAYAIEEYASAPGALRRWVDDVVGTIKAWVFQRFGRQMGAVTPAQLRSIAAAALRDGVGLPGDLVGAQSRRRSIADRSGGPSVARGATISAKRVAEEFSGKWTDVQPKMLALLPLNYFTEIKRRGMVAIDQYLKVKRQMDAYRGNKHSEMDALAQDWRKFARLGFGPGRGVAKTRAAQLADLMHEATIAGVDPSRTNKENTIKARYEVLRAKFLALPPVGRELFVKVRDAYKAQADELDGILLDNVRKTQEIAFRRIENEYREALQRIAESNLDALEKSMAEAEAAQRYGRDMNRATMNMKARMTKMRLAFESSRVPEPYFPLARFGQYTVTVRDLDGTVISFSKRETAAEQRRLAQDMRAAYPTAKVETGVMSEGADPRDAMDPRLVAEIESILGDAGVDRSVMDAIYQRYLETMPDLSARKRFIHRKGTAGFEGDALRTFASHMFHAAHQMARLKYGLDLQELANQAVDQARASDDPVAGGMIANELKLRHKWVMNPTGSRPVQAVTSAMFLWHLAATPAAALVNLSQTPMLALPILGARLGGIGKASAALVRASGDILRGRGSALRSQLTADEKRAMEAFYESGMIDRTQAHDLAGVGEVGVAYSPVRQKLMAAVSWLYHNAEVWNREVTALAAYRLAREAGQHEVAAIDTAHELVWKSHFDYSNSSRARFMQGDVGKLLLVFQSHQLNMWYRLFRDMHQSFKGAAPQARREARYQLAGILGMMTLMGGVTGFFGYNVLVTLAGLAFDDDDDPRSFKAEMEGHVIDLLGPDLGGMVLKGVPGHLTGIDLTSRIGMPDFFVRAPYGNAEGRAWLEDFLVGAMGVVPSTVFRSIDGFSLIMEGKVARGIETMAPKAINDLMQAYRYWNEGVLTRRGDVTLDRANIDAWDVVAQSIGFTPAKVAETYERIDALKDAEQHVIDERRALINRFAMAYTMGDDAAREDAAEAIRRWNRKPYAAAVPITGDSLRQSLRMRQVNAAKRNDGALITDPELSHYLREQMPARIY